MVAGSWWRKRLGVGGRVSEPQEDSVLEEELGRVEPERAERVAVFAALLARVAFADEEVSDLEVRSIAETVVRYGGMAESEAEAVAHVARDRTVALRGVDDNRLTRRFNEVASEDDKVGLLECLYAVATADDLVTHVEDREIRRIADALLVPASRILEIRSRHREKLEELRELRSIRGRS